jgi:DNA-nicking Smr family endonuclease
MNFKDILEDWERLTAKPGGLDAAAEAEKRLRDEDARLRLEDDEAPARATSAARDALSSWLDSHGTVDKDGESPSSQADGPGARAAREAEIRRIKAKKPEATIDLHGMKADEAEAALAVFLEESARQGFEKVLVVTGKGIHSSGEPVLGKVARRVLEASPLAGRFGTAEAALGGGGALWVILRRRDYFSR